MKDCNNTVTHGGALSVDYTTTARRAIQHLQKDTLIGMTGWKIYDDLHPVCDGYAWSNKRIESCFRYRFRIGEIAELSIADIVNDDISLQKCNICSSFYIDSEQRIRVITYFSVTFYNLYGQHTMQILLTNRLWEAIDVSWIPGRVKRMPSLVCGMRCCTLNFLDNAHAVRVLMVFID